MPVCSVEDSQSARILQAPEFKCKPAPQSRAALISADHFGLSPMMGIFVSS
jgi:hypothetical protein